MLHNQRKCKFVVADEVLGRELLEIRAAFGKGSSTSRAIRKRVITWIVYTHEIPHIQCHHSIHKHMHIIINMHTHTPCNEANQIVVFLAGRGMQGSHTHI